MPSNQSIDTFNASAMIGSSKSGTRRLPLSILLIAIWPICRPATCSRAASWSCVSFALVRADLIRSPEILHLPSYLACHSDDLLSGETQKATQGIRISRMPWVAFPQIVFFCFGFNAGLLLFSASAIIFSSNPLSENSACNRTAGAYPPLDLEAKRKRKNHFHFHRHILFHWWFYRFQLRACTCCAGWTPDANSADLGLQNNCRTCRFWKSVYGIITEMNYLWKIPDDWLLLYSVAAIKHE